MKLQHLEPSNENNVSLISARDMSRSKKKHEAKKKKFPEKKKKKKKKKKENREADTATKADGEWL